MQEIIAVLVSLVLLQPLQAEMAETLAAARAPKAIVDQVTGCARTAAPLVVERAVGDPWWTVTTIVRFWLGAARPETMLMELAPGCARAVEAAQPFLKRQVS